MKVYLATSGEYSDYRVREVFAREDDARAYQLGDDVEEFEVRESPVDVRSWLILYWYAAQPDKEHPSSFGNANPHWSSELRSFDGNPRSVEHRWQEGGLRADEWPVLIVQGWNRDAVAKVYSEQRAKWLAEREG